MNIKNDQIRRLEAAIGLLGSKPLSSREQGILLDAQYVLHELETARDKLNARSAGFISEKRKDDPLYGRSREYKKARIEKAKRIIELYEKGESTDEPTGQD